ncbi:hypothetical protein [Microbacterium istanbulense]|uniref:Uncharacterized protein n=1 Tax=Microbacterium istanbulense TaxID=3122049 RepID=A0ABU8LL81_9MICO
MLRNSDAGWSDAAGADAAGADACRRGCRRFGCLPARMPVGAESVEAS